MSFPMEKLKLPDITYVSGFWRVVGKIVTLGDTKAKSQVVIIPPSIDICYNLIVKS